MVMQRVWEGHEVTKNWTFAYFKWYDDILRAKDENMFKMEKCLIEFMWKLFQQTLQQSRAISDTAAVVPLPWLRWFNEKTNKKLFASHPFFVFALWPRPFWTISNIGRNIVMYKNVFLIVRVCSRWLLRNMVVWLHSMMVAYSQHELSLWMDVLEDYKHLWSTLISYSSFCIRWHRMFSRARSWNGNYRGSTSTQSCALNRGCTSRASFSQHPASVVLI